MNTELLDKIAELMGDLEEDELLEAVKEAIAVGISKAEVVGALQKGMEIVGDLFSQKEYFIAELGYSADLFEECTQLFPEDEDEGEARYGTFLIGTVYTDLHDIGKNITAQLYKCNGFKVVDLGVDVRPETFMEAIKTYDPTVIGISALLTTSFDPLKDTIAQIRNAGLADGRFLYIGGAPIDANTCKYVNADDWTNDAQYSLRKSIAFVEAHR